jgi:hypothetical protein
MVVSLGIMCFQAVSVHSHADKPFDHQCVPMLQKTVLFMPVLYIVFGMPLDTLIIIAFYSWGCAGRQRKRPTCKQGQPRQGGNASTLAQEVPSSNLGAPTKFLKQLVQPPKGALLKGGLAVR